ncbi:MAG TPA: hypothetical protein VGN72_00500 [Tepidisphaeraceae bacterium]|jgi:hypothetical protein|nr:hypothetical protein [Tepidisphaeraceae bacterium]
MKTVRKLFKFFVFVTWLAGWALAAAAVHVVRSPEAEGSPMKVTLITKERLNFHDTYVDTRSWSITDAFDKHPMVSRRMFETGRGELLAHLGTGSDVERLKAELEQATIVPATEVHHDAGHGGGH